MGEFGIQTAQNVTINQRLAGIGERIMALILDIFVLILFYILVIKLLSMTDFVGRFETVVYIFVLTLPYFLYYPVLQYWNNGQSFGKQLMKIRIVKIDNSHPRLLDFIIRWLFRLIEINMIPGLAIIIMLFNDKRQRLGDIVAKTTVVSERNKVKLTQSIFTEIDDDYKPVFPVVQQLSDHDIQLIKNVYSDVKRSQNKEILRRLVIKIERVLNIEKPKDMSQVHFVNTILKDYNYYSHKIL